MKCSPRCGWVFIQPIDDSFLLVDGARGLHRDLESSEGVSQAWIRITTSAMAATAAIVRMREASKERVMWSDRAVKQWRENDVSLEKKSQKTQN